MEALVLRVTKEHESYHDRRRRTTTTTVIDTSVDGTTLQINIWACHLSRVETFFDDDTFFDDSFFFNFIDDSFFFNFNVGLAIVVSIFLDLAMVSVSPGVKNGKRNWLTSL